MLLLISLSAVCFSCDFASLIIEIEKYDSTPCDHLVGINLTLKYLLPDSTPCDHLVGINLT